MAFDLTEVQMQAFSEYKASYLPSQVSTSPTFCTAVGEHVSSLARLAEPDTCVRRREFIKSELTDDEFRERVLLKDGARVVVGGIRFQNLNPRFPFVEINSNFDLFTPEWMQHLASVARQHYGGFAPKGILAVGPPHIGLSSGVESWSHAVGGPATVTGNSPLPLELMSSFPAGVDFYNQYCAAYVEWQASAPRLSSFVRPEPREDLEASAARQLLATFADAAGWSGLVAAREEPFMEHGLSTSLRYSWLSVGAAGERPWQLMPPSSRASQADIASFGRTFIPRIGRRWESLWLADGQFSRPTTSFRSATTVACGLAPSESSSDWPHE